MWLGRGGGVLRRVYVGAEAAVAQVTAGGGKGPEYEGNWDCGMGVVWA